jgi:hypothetical protein
MDLTPEYSLSNISNILTKTKYFVISQYFDEKREVSGTPHTFLLRLSKLRGNIFPERSRAHTG